MKYVQFTAAGLALALVADSANGKVVLDYDGPAKIVEAMSSATSSGPNFNVMYAENTIIGDGNDVTEPEGQRTGEPFLGYAVARPFDRVLLFGDTFEMKTDPSSGSVILPAWPRRST